MNVPSYQHICKSMHVLQCDIACPLPCSHISCDYPKKVWLINVYINCNVHANACIKDFLAMYVAIDIKWRVRSKHDNKMNTLAFVNFLLIKIFPTLIHQNFPSKFCAIQYIHTYIESKISKVLFSYTFIYYHCELMHSYIATSIAANMSTSDGYVEYLLP